jgi:DNA helicase TIP49 (TBP-interacting protein)
MAVVITQTQLRTLKIKVSAMGAVTEIKEVLSAVPLNDIDSITVKRMGLGGILAITARGGNPIKLECRVGPARELADAFERAKANA